MRSLGSSLRKFWVGVFFLMLNGNTDAFFSRLLVL
jgi:hypothetical protein